MTTYMEKASADAATARARAKELLMSFLNPAQQESYRQYGFFFVKGNDGGYYGLWSGYSAIEFDTRGNPRVIYGFSLAHTLPHDDMLLAQMFLLQTNAQFAKALACHYRVVSKTHLDSYGLGRVFRSNEAQLALRDYLLDSQPPQAIRPPEPARRRNLLKRIFGID